MARKDLWKEFTESRREAETALLRRPIPSPKSIANDVCAPDYVHRKLVASARPKKRVRRDSPKRAAQRAAADYRRRFRPASIQHQRIGLGNRGPERDATAHTALRSAAVPEQSARSYRARRVEQLAKRAAIVCAYEQCSRSLVPADPRTKFCSLRCAIDDQAATARADRRAQRYAIRCANPHCESGEFTPLDTRTVCCSPRCVKATYRLRKQAAAGSRAA